MAEHTGDWILSHRAGKAEMARALIEAHKDEYVQIEEELAFDCFLVSGDADSVKLLGRHPLFEGTERETIGYQLSGGQA